MQTIIRYTLLILLFTLFIEQAQAQQRKRTKKKAQTQRHQTTHKLVAAPVHQQTVEAITLNPTDTTPKIVTITSSFKPTLKLAAKIPFTAATPVIDTNKISLQYQIPSQNLFFVYQPVPIKPIALETDSAREWVNHGYIKAGAGNINLPYLDAKIAFGDGNYQSIVFNGTYLHSKGSILFQENSKLNVGALARFSTTTNIFIDGGINFENSNQYKYGTTANYNFKQSDLQQNFNTIGLQVALQNKAVGHTGISYHPEIKVNRFFDNKDGGEWNIVLRAPIHKQLNKLFSFDIAVTADITSYKNLSSTISNNLLHIAPQINFDKDNFKIMASLQPNWNNNAFNLLPNFTVEGKPKNIALTIMGGWLSYFTKNSYQSLAAVNPFIEQPSSLFNTKTVEQYFGLKGNAGGHLSFNARLSFLKINQPALFANDTAALNTQTFKVLYEPELKAIRLKGELAYSLQEKISLIASLNYTQYTAQQLYSKPYGLIPLQITAGFRAKIFKDVLVKSDIYFLSGNNYRDKSLSDFRTKSALDLNAGFEFPLLPKLNLWMDFNNILSTVYQRWNQYNAFGFNFTGGIVYSFR